MNEFETIVKTLKNQLDAGFPLVLISVTDLQGSTPRHEGSKMIVGANGKTYGTIGGSLIEAAAIKEAQNVLAAGESKIMSFELNGKDAAAPGMICGGKAEIFLDYVSSSEENNDFANGLVQAISGNKEFFLLTHYRQSGLKVEVLGRAVMDTECNFMDGGNISHAVAMQLKTELHNISTISVMPVGNANIIVDRIRKVKTVFCFGGGHVAVPTVHLAALVGFRTVVIDDRQEFANAERFPEAAATKVLTDYTKAMSGLEIDKDSFIVIVTRGHKYDREVLEASLKTDAGYIGMISSQRKREAIYEALKAAGVKKERLEFVHSPIGIDIGGETPEEIAVSIVAELIKVRSGQSS
jgi:xanthine dehydrogenase accessory factor